MSSLFMHHRLRKMVNMTDKNSFETDLTGLDLCLGLTQDSSVTERSWSWEPNQNVSTYVSSEEVQGINDKLGNIDQKLNILVAGHTSGDDDHSNGPVAKRESFCSSLCSFFVIIAHDVVLFVTRGSTTNKREVLFPLTINQSVN